VLVAEGGLAGPGVAGGEPLEQLGDRFELDDGGHAARSRAGSEKIREGPRRRARGRPPRARSGGGRFTAASPRAPVASGLTPPPPSPPPTTRPRARTAGTASGKRAATSAPTWIACDPPASRRSSSRCRRPT